MSFTFKNEDGDEVRKIHSCNDCLYCSTTRHFRDTEDGLRCPKCGGTTRHIDEQVKSPGMSSFQYRRLRESLQQQCDGVGNSTVSNIEDEFSNGTKFVEACKKAYDEQAYDELTVVTGIGKSTARTIALAMADMRDWEDGKAEMSFDVA